MDNHCTNTVDALCYNIDENISTKSVDYFDVIT